MSRLTRAKWWEGEDTEDRDVAIEVERSDDDEVAILIRGLSGEDDSGAAYLTVEAARAVATDLSAAASVAALEKGRVTA